ncbi:hypothetical protein [Novosphingobium sp. PhB165]|uniref:hypothetical protein n=1 Tax=Novosphingobium sp. PhB165 TaxID=2485105 RepID=UPI0014049ACA|nr:hypothetical protein [Novosphingobium sp. PhB165]
MKIRIERLADGELLGQVADDTSSNPWVRTGAEVRLYLNEPGTVFRSPDTLGIGRVYEDRVEVDMILPPSVINRLLTQLSDGKQACLGLDTHETGEYTFRVLSCTSQSARQESKPASRYAAAAKHAA